MADTLTDSDILKAAPQVLTDADIAAQDQKASGWLDSVERLGQGFYGKTLKPLVDTGAATVHAVANPGETAKAIANSDVVQHPVDTVAKAAKSAYERHGQMLQDAKASLAKGDYDDAIQRGTNALIPILGPQIQSSVDRIKSGDVAGGVGELSGLAASVLAAAPGAVEEGAGMLGNAATWAKGAAAAGGKDVAVGAAKTAAGAALPVALAHIPGGAAIETGAELVGVPAGLKLAKQGAQQMVEGVKKAGAGGKAAIAAKIDAASTANNAVRRLEEAFDPATAPKTDMQLAAPIDKQPSMAGPAPVSGPPTPANIPPRSPRAPIPMSPRERTMAPGGSGLGVEPVKGTVSLPYKEALNPANASSLAEGDNMTLPDGSAMTLKRVPIDDIEPDSGNSVDQSKVDEYKQNGWQVAPILKAGEESPYRVFDGHHRITAAAQNGESDVLAWTPSEAQPTTIPFSKADKPAEFYAAPQRAAKAPLEQQMAEAMHQGGLTSADLKDMKADDWKTLAGKLGIKAPTVGAQGRIAFNLGQIEKATPAAGPQLVKRLKDTGAMPIAEQLRNAMNAH